MTDRIGGSLVEQARALSSGTFGSLTGFSRYDQVDPVRVAFVLWCVAHEAEFETWQPAWRVFWAESQVDLVQLERNVRLLAEGEGLSLLEALSLLQTGAAKAGCESLLDALCDLKARLLEDRIQAILSR